MKTEERRKLQKANLKLSISSAARAIVQKEGWEALTIRKVADAIGYSAPTIYEFFEDKSALLYEVMEIGYGEWLEDIQKATQSKKSKEGFVNAVADATWEFAFKKKELYLLMHSLPAIPFGTEKAPKNARAIYQHIFDGLQRYKVTFHDPEIAVEMIWATMHGWISLTLTGRIKGGRKRAEGIFFEAIELLTRNLFEKN
jgi:AcrR family transcriptional regulator